ECSSMQGGFRQMYDARRRIAGGRLSFARTERELPESRPHATSMSRMNNCNSSALVPARKSSNGVQSPRLQCHCPVTATYLQYETGWWLSVGDLEKALTQAGASFFFPV